MNTSEMPYVNHSLKFIEESLSSTTEFLLQRAVNFTHNVQETANSLKLEQYLNSAKQYSNEEILKLTQLINSLEQATLLYASVAAIIVVLMCVVLIILFSRFRKKGLKNNTNTSVTSNTTELTNTSQHDDSNPNLHETITSPKIGILQKSKHTISITTDFNLDEFLGTIHIRGFLVQRVKAGEKKSRSIRINNKGDFCVYKCASSGKLGESPVQIAKNPYVRFNLTELKECFECTSKEPAVILEFKKKVFHFLCLTGLDAHYIAQGLNCLKRTVKEDKKFLSSFESRLSSIVALQSTRHATVMVGTQVVDDIDDDAASVSTAGTLSDNRGIMSPQRQQLTPRSPPRK